MTTCCVPFCRCTTKRVFYEWICGSHWKLVDRSLRREKREAETRWKDEGNEFWPTYDAVWQRCKTQAIERALR